MTVMVDNFSVEYSVSNSFGRWRRLMPLEAMTPTYSRGMFPNKCFGPVLCLSQIVEKLFNKGWKHRNKPKPCVHAIFKVISPEGTLQPYRDYL
jgi:hypothetical protein